MKNMKISPDLLILCNEGDINIKLIADWLINFNLNFFILNTSLFEIEIKLFDSKNQYLLLNLECENSCIDLDLSNVKVCFSRGNKIKFKTIKSKLITDFNYGFKSYKSVYYHNLDDFLKYYLNQNVKFIGAWGDGLLNKLKVLHLQKRLG